MKFYVNDLNDLNKEEREHNKASYKRVIDLYINDLVLCNELPYIDESIWENVQNFDVLEDYNEIYQYYLCNLSDYEKNSLINYGVIISYSEMLGVDVLMVNHYGTSWDYVLTNNEITTDIKEVIK